MQHINNMPTKKLESYLNNMITFYKNNKFDNKLTERVNNNCKEYFETKTVKDDTQKKDLIELDSFINICLMSNNK